MSRRQIGTGRNRVAYRIYTRSSDIGTPATGDRMPKFSLKGDLAIPVLARIWQSAPSNLDLLILYEYFHKNTLVSSQIEPEI